MKTYMDMIGGLQLFAKLGRNIIKYICDYAEVCIPELLLHEGFPYEDDFVVDADEEVIFINLTNCWHLEVFVDAVLNSVFLYVTNKLPLEVSHELANFGEVAG